MVASTRPRTLSPRRHRTAAAIDTCGRHSRGLATAWDPEIADMLPAVEGFPLAAKGGAYSGELDRCSASVRSASIVADLMEELPAQGENAGSLAVGTGAGDSGTEENSAGDVEDKKVAAIVEAAVEARTRLMSRIFQTRLRDEIVRMHQTHRWSQRHWMSPYLHRFLLVTNVLSHQLPFLLSAPSSACTTPS